MPVPNFANINTLYETTSVANLTTSFTNLVVNYANSNSLIVVNSIIVSNPSTTLSTNVTINLVNVISGFSVNLFSFANVTPSNTLILTNRRSSITVPENFAINANTSVANTFVTVSYSEISSATGDNFKAEIRAACPLRVCYVVIAGGGAGGAGTGGGAGGLLRGNINLVNYRSYVITVGGGGAFIPGVGLGYPSGCSGSNSTIFATTDPTLFSNPGFSQICIDACGGGAGGVYGSWTNGSTDGLPGGSGGGGATTTESPASASRPGGSGVPGQGNPGGPSVGAAAGVTNSGGGGGGGAGSSGTQGNTSIGGMGGSGVSIVCRENLNFCIGGGGGGIGGPSFSAWVAASPCQFANAGGGLGGGSGGFPSCGAGISGKGGGGGGGMSTPFGGGGGGGGGGLVVISYPGNPAATGGNVYTALGITQHIFNATGVLTLNLRS